MISHERLLEVLHYNPETGVWTNIITRSSGAVAGEHPGNIKKGYRRIRIDNKVYTSARLAWFYMTRGQPLFTIDHINRVRDDDRFCNIRDVTMSENNRNKEGISYSGDGVYYRKDRNQYRARTYVEGRRVHIGNFYTFDEALAAYNRFTTNRATAA